MPSIGTPLLWSGFTAAVVLLLAVDLIVFHHREHVIRFREALAWSLFWIALSVAFGIWLTWRFGHRPGLEYFAGYIVEESLSVDNLFVFLLLFRYFAVPQRFQHRVLFWGIFGAICTRALFILLGISLLTYVHWTIYVFGALLLFTGYRVLTHTAEQIHPERNPVVRLLRRVIPMTRGYHGKHFFAREEGRSMATPLLLVLVVIEVSDLIFAVDSVPAVLAVTRDPFIAFASNILAILGLRALYFIIADLLRRLEYLHIGLGLILIFVGLKMLASDLYEIPIGVSLLGIAVLIAIAVVASLAHQRRGPTT